MVIEWNPITGECFSVDGKPYDPNHCPLRELGRKVAEAKNRAVMDVLLRNDLPSCGESHR